MEDIISVSYTHLDVYKRQEEEMAKKEPDSVQLGILQYILGVQYLSINQKENAMRVLKKAKQNLRHTPYSQKVKALLVK